MNTGKANFHAPLIALSLVLAGSTTRADNPMPPVPEGGLMTVAEGSCTDIATNVEGYCVMSSDMHGNIYVTWMIDNEIVEIRQITGNTYTVLWAATPGDLM